uniref:Pecanex-like protein n=1 Tax=Schistocephalus solidus TaxID=70667 RepID=A0A183SZ70_SCHSO
LKFSPMFSLRFFALLLFICKSICDTDILDSGRKVSFSGIRDTCMSPVALFFFQWNSKGYDIAKLFAIKFSHISPVWLRLPPSESCTVEGLHDIDSSWISAVRSVNEDVKFLPRLLFDGWTESDYQKLLRHSRYYLLIALSYPLLYVGFDFLDRTVSPSIDLSASKLIS